MGTDGGGEDPAEAMARAQFTAQVAPSLSGNCNACHVSGAGGAPVFGGTYDELTAYNAGSLLNCTDPTMSLLITKGAHPPGPAFPAGDLPTVTAWVTGAWATAVCGGDVTPTGAAKTAPFVPQLDVENSVDIAGLATGIAGARITFTPTRVPGGIYISGIKAVAGPTGLTIVTPVFEACLAGTAETDPGNAFANVNLTVPAGETLNLGGGTMSFIGWQLDNPMAISFAGLGPEAGAVGPYTPGSGSCGI